MSEEVFAECLEIMAPLSGFLMEIEAVPDSTFAQKLAGDGLAIDPVTNILKAPVAGEIIQLHAASHALTIKTPHGIEILIHIGLDTVKLGGEGFEALVKEGERVAVGQELIKFDADYVATNARSLLTLIVIANPESISSLTKASGSVDAGADVIFSVVPARAAMQPAEIQQPQNPVQAAGPKPEKFNIVEYGRGNKFEQSEFNNAIQRATLQLSAIEDKFKRVGNHEKAAVFAAQAELLDDPELLELVERAIIAGKSAPYAWNKAFNNYAEKLRKLNDRALVRRAGYLRNVGKRVLRILFSIEENNLDLDEVHESSVEEGFHAEKVHSVEESQTALPVKEPVVTTDGTEIAIYANIGDISSAKQSVNCGFAGIGLLRSEFLFMNRVVAPTEDEQYRAYLEIAETMGKDGPITIRTLDIDGKIPPCLAISEENNPALGQKGIRDCLKRPEIFVTQLRAILRVAQRFDVRVVFPMIADISEWHQAVELLRQAAEALGVKPVKSGVVMEIPSAALLADVFAAEADFFVIETSDLAQYAMAIDRSHPVLAAQLDSMHPAVLRLMTIVAEAGRKRKIEVSACGSLAADIKGIAALIGMGISNLSVDISAVSTLKNTVLRLSEAQCTRLVRVAVRMSDAVSVRRAFKKLIAESGGEA